MGDLVGSDREVFRKKYDDEASDWGGTSGPGSDPFYTIEYRALVSRLIRLNKIGSVVDIGCGDWQFSRFIDFGSASYLGLDVVESVVASNKKQYTTPSVDFRIMPGELSSIPGGDMLLMKDVLQHLPDQEIFDIRDQVLGKFKYYLITNSYRKIGTAQNVDIRPGAFRCLDLMAPPYNFHGCYVLEFGSAAWEHIRVLLGGGAG